VVSGLGLDAARRAYTVGFGNTVAAVSSIWPDPADAAQHQRAGPPPAM